MNSASICVKSVICFPHIKRGRERITGNMDLKASGNVLEGSRNHGNIESFKKKITHIVFTTPAALLFCQSTCRRPLVEHFSLVYY